MTTWADAAAHIDFTISSSWTNATADSLIEMNSLQQAAILNTMSALYSSSDTTFKAMIDDLTDGRDLRIGISATGSFYEPIGDFFSFNSTVDSGNYYISEHGVWVQSYFPLTVAHEIAHSYYGTHDPAPHYGANPTFDYKGNQVITQNAVASDLGMPELRQASYGAGIPAGSAMLSLMTPNHGYTDGHFINISIMGTDSTSDDINISSRVDNPDTLLFGFGGEDSITGNSGIDYIYGGTGNDVLTGGGGNDHLFGEAGNDTLQGGAGSDSLSGGIGNDSIDGGADNDTIDGSEGADTISGGDGDDLLRVGNDTIVLQGSDGNDTLVSSASGPDDNSLFGGDGDDLLLAMSDTNTIDGGAGNDLVVLTSQQQGGDGPVHDTVVFRKDDGQDTIFFGGSTLLSEDRESVTTSSLYRTSFSFPDINHDDLVVLFSATPWEGPEMDTRIIVFKVISTGSYIYMTEDANTFYYPFSGPIIAGPDPVFGGIDHGDGSLYDIEDDYDDHPYHFADGDFDLLHYVVFSDLDEYKTSALGSELNGTSGDDVLEGSEGNDSISAGNGNDTIVFLGHGFGGFDDIDGGDGNDAILANADNRWIQIGDLLGVETISSNGHSGVSLLGSPGHNIIDLSGSTLIGISSIDGGRGNDTIIGSSTSDTILGGVGNDSISGGGGNDLIIVAHNGGFDALDGGAGSNAVYAADDDVTVGILTLDNIDTISANGHSGVSITAGDNDDDLDFSAVTLVDIESINGGDGNDTIVGGAGGDTISGEFGDDDLAGGYGNDAFLYDGEWDGYDSVDGGPGTDSIVVTQDWTYLDFYSLTNIEIIDGSGHEGVILQVTDDGQILDLSGVELIDIFEIDGIYSNDTIIGSAGNDRISGGDGADVLTGGTGADTFYYWGASNSPAGSGRDILADFTPSTDLIDLGDIDANTVSGGDQAFSFIGTSAFGSVGGQLRYQVVGSDVVVIADRNGDGVGDFEIQLTGVSTLTSADFLL